jgi:hypothetical protein
MAVTIGRRRVVTAGLAVTAGCITRGFAANTIMSETSEHGLGFVPDDPEIIDWDASSAMEQPSNNIRPIIDYEALLDRVRDQQRTNACVSFATCNSAYLRSRYRGKNPVYPSLMFGYSLGRASALPDQVTPLADSGSQPSRIFQAYRQWGFCDETTWPWDVSQINQRPRWSMLTDGSNHLLAGYKWITSTGENRVLDVAAALTVGYFPTLKIAADEAVTNPGSLIDGPIVNSRGDHYVVLVGYDASEKRFRLLNSWGAGWGDGGFAWISAGRIADPSTGAVAYIETVNLG